MKIMKSVKRFLFALTALTVALTAAPAAAQERILEFFFPAPTVTEYCYTEGGYWAWDGIQYSWVSSRTVCHYQ